VGNPVVWFELYTPDVERAKEFYMNCYEAIIMGRTQWETRTRQA